MYKKTDSFSGAEIVATLNGEVIGEFNAIKYQPRKERISSDVESVDISIKLENIPSENVNRVTEEFCIFLEKTKGLRNPEESN